MKRCCDLRISAATSDQIDDIYTIMSDVAAHMAHPEYYVTDDRDYIARHISQEGFTLLWTERNTVAGFLIVHLPTPSAPNNLGLDLGFSPDQLALVAHMESAAILPQFRGRGIQKKLILTAENSLRAQGFRYCLCTVHPDNLPSFYSLTDLGYQVAATKLKYGGKLRYIMKKEL